MRRGKHWRNNAIRKGKMRRRRATLKGREDVKEKKLLDYTKTHSHNITSR